MRHFVITKKKATFRTILQKPTNKTFFKNQTKQNKRKQSWKHTLSSKSSISVADTAERDVLLDIVCNSLQCFVSFSNTDPKEFCSVLCGTKQLFWKLFQVFFTLVQLCQLTPCVHLPDFPILYNVSSHVVQNILFSLFTASTTISHHVQHPYNKVCRFHSGTGIFHKINQPMKFFFSCVFLQINQRQQELCQVYGEKWDIFMHG